MTDPTPDPTETLTAWRAVTEGASDGPWFEDDDGGVSTEPRAHTMTSTPIVDTEGCGMGNPADAAFIAASRTAMPRLIAFAEAVLALHRPVEVEPSDTICSECSTRLPNGRYLPTVEWPCPTAALAEHLGGEGQ